MNTSKRICLLRLSILNGKVTLYGRTKLYIPNAYTEKNMTRSIFHMLKVNSQNKVLHFSMLVFIPMAFEIHSN